MLCLGVFLTLLVLDVHIMASDFVVLGDLCASGHVSLCIYMCFVRFTFFPPVCAVLLFFFLPFLFPCFLMREKEEKGVDFGEWGGR